MQEFLEYQLKILETCLHRLKIDVYAKSKKNTDINPKIWFDVNWPNNTKFGLNVMKNSQNWRRLGKNQFFEKIIFFIIFFRKFTIWYTRSFFSLFKLTGSNFRSKFTNKVIGDFPSLP